MFKTAIIDPPWPYPRTSKHKKLTGYADKQYETELEMKDLMVLPVGEVVSSYLFLWATSPWLPAAMKLVEAWGFEFRTMLYWHKSTVDPIRESGWVRYRPHFGVGFWFRGDTEPIVFASRKGAPAIRTNERATLLAQRTRHSRKPAGLHELVERHFPGPYLELFAREGRVGWTALGDQYDGADIRTSLPALLRVAA